MVKSIQESGTLEDEGDKVVSATSFSEILAPDTVQDVIMARIDRLGEEPKRVLQLAAVIGREFTGRLLDRLAGTHDGTDAAMRELKAKELIYEKSLFPEPAYLFKHALTQDVAYSSLLIKRRRDLHGSQALRSRNCMPIGWARTARSSPTISPGPSIGRKRSNIC